MRYLMTILVLATSLCTPQAQSCLPRGIQFRTQAEIDAFPAQYPGCTQILGNVQIIKSALINNLDGLRGLISVKGNLAIIENRSLQSLKGLSALRFVGGTLNIAGNHSLQDLSGLEAVEHVGGNLAIDDNASMTTVDALLHLRSVGGRCGFYNCKMLERLNGCNRLQQVGGYLDIHNCDGLLEVGGFDALKRVGGVWILDNEKTEHIRGFNRLDSIGDNFDIRNQKALKTISGFQQLSMVGNALVLDNDSLLTDISGLQNVRSVGKSIVVLRMGALPDLSGLKNLVTVGGVEIRDNLALWSLEGLNRLQAVKGLLQLINNKSLTDLGALKNVTSIKGILQIVDNPALTTLAGLDNIDYTSVENLILSGCDRLDYCAVPSICDYLNFGRNAEIANNATRCNGKAAIMESNLACHPNFTSKAKSIWQSEQGRWLLALLALAIAGAILALSWYRKRQRHRLMRLRTALAQDLHDDLGSEMSGMALTSYLAARSGDPARMRDTLDAIAQQSEKLVEDMRDIVWTIHPDNDSLEKMVGRMKIYAHKLLDEQEVSLHFDISSDALPVKMEPEARKHLYLFFKEAMNNLAKYAQASAVNVGVRQEQGLFIFEVQDNGRGFDPALPSEGNGLRNLRSRAAALNGSLDIESGVGQGTTVRLRAWLK